MKKLLTIIVVLIFISTNFADTTYVSGTIVNQTWTPAGSPYCVTNDILVAGLSIQPGVKIIFLGNYLFEVAGILTATGIAENVISFTAIDTVTGWKGILFQNSVPGSEMSWCKIERSNTSGVRIIESFPDINNCAIVKNKSLENGGGIKIILTIPGVLEIEGCNISDNKTITNYTISPSNGAGIYVSANPTSVNFNHCVIKNNRAERYDGHVWGGGVYISGNVSFSRCLISGNSVYGADQIPGGNSAGRGGGIYIEQGIVALMNSEINNNNAIGTASGGMSGNQGYASGGGLHFENGQLNISNTIFNNNFASGSHVTQGGGLFANAGQIQLDNSTVAYSNVHAIYNNTSVMNIINSIIYFNNAGGVQINGSVSITYCDIQGGFTGVGNINFNPVFQSIDSLIIVPGSLCIDAGSPDLIYNDECSPPSLGTNRNDIGAHGGPGGCGWLNPIIPVELISFTGEFLENKIQLNWLTATEINNKQFDIERSTDSKTFSIVGTVEGNGTTTEKHEYSFIDKPTQIGKYFYRLKQVDLDGSFKYSQIVEVNFNNIPDKYVLLQNYPNPFNPNTKISWQSPVGSWQTLKIYDVLGNEVTTLVNEYKPAGSYEVEFSAIGGATNLPSGVYFYQLQAENFVQTKKMIILK